MLPVTATDKNSVTGNSDRQKQCYRYERQTVFADNECHYFQDTPTINTTINIINNKDYLWTLMSKFYYSFTIIQGIIFKISKQIFFRNSFTSRCEKLFNGRSEASKSAIANTYTPHDVLSY